MYSIDGGDVGAVGAQAPPLFTDEGRAPTNLKYSDDINEPELPPFVQS